MWKSSVMASWWWYVCCHCPGAEDIKKAMAICDSVALDISTLMNWARDAFVTMAMGSYPYPTNYMTSGGGNLPAYPLRAACNAFLSKPLSGQELLEGQVTSRLPQTRVFEADLGNKYCRAHGMDDNRCLCVKWKHCQCKMDYRPMQPPLYDWFVVGM